jgi:hypothetical protein
MGIIRDATFAAGRLLPDRASDKAFARATADALVTLCLHRIDGVNGERAPLGERSTIAADDLDEIVERCASAVDRTDRWLTVTFDDGYAEVPAYVASRAPRYPQVDWIIFACPRRAETAEPFPWDASRSGGTGAPSVRLATVDELRSVASLPNVLLGNHTNGHVEAAKVPLEQWRHDVETSFDDFERLFGATDHFAFPFGTPNLNWGSAQLAAVRARFGGSVWSTEPLVERDGDVAPGGVRPRFSLDGRLKPSEIIAEIAVTSARQRRGSIGKVAVS